MINEDFVIAHRQRAMNPDRPVLRGTAQNPDVFFQAREACNPFYAKCAGHHGQGHGQVRRHHRPPIQAFRIRRRPQRRARPGASWARAARPRTRRWITSTSAARRSACSRCGSIRPLQRRGTSWKRSRPSVKAIAVLDRTKESGALGEPLYLDIVTGLERGPGRRARASSSAMPKVVGGRYGLSSKDFTPAMVKAVFDNLAAGQVRRTTSPSASTDDVTHTSLESIPSSPPSRTRWCARCSTASARTARSAPTRTPSRSSARTPTTTRRAISSMTRRKPARSPSRTCASGRSPSAPLPGQQGQLRRLPPADLPGPLRHAQGPGAGRHVPAQHAYAAKTRSGTNSPARRRKP